MEGDVMYGTQGGAWANSATIKIASDLQYALTKDILDENFDRVFWKKKLLDLKNKVYEFKLEEEHIVKYSTVSRSVDTYGKPVIDSKTGEQKIRKSDGAKMFAPVPAHIKIAKQKLKAGEEIEVGDKVGYIVLDQPPIVPISIEDFRKKPAYDADYYWEKLERPVLEILEAVFKDFFPVTAFEFSRLPFT